MQSLQGNIGESFKKQKICEVGVRVEVNSG